MIVHNTLSLLITYFSTGLMKESLVDFVESALSGSKFETPPVDVGYYRAQLDLHVSNFRDGEKTMAPRVIYTTVQILARHGEKKLSREYARLFEEHIRPKI